jgi:hypothetical protein
MGVPKTGIEAADQPAAEGLLSAFKTIDSAERQRHAQVLSYWLSIRGDKEFPPLHDLDPLEISDAGPSSVLLELISGGHDADIRHLGEALRHEGWPEQIMDAPNPSILACIAKKLPIVAISRDFLAFEDEYSNDTGTTRCWVTLLPLSGGGAWVDYVYALVSFDSAPAKAGNASEKPAKKVEAKEAAPEQVEEPAAEQVEEPIAEAAPEPEVPAEPVAEVAPEEEVAEAALEEVAEPVAEAEPSEPEEAEEPEPVSEEPEPVTDQVDEPVAQIEQPAAPEPQEEEPREPVAAAIAKAAPGFSKLFDSLAGLTGFYAQGVKVEPVIPEESAPADEPEEPTVDEAAEPKQAAEEAEKDLQPENAADEQPAEPQADEAPAKAAKQPTRASEGILQSKLTEVRAKADEARQARLRANAALYEGLSAAYDFALDAEDSPEEYLRMVEAKGLKIQLRSPMTPVVKLAFDGLCDDGAIAQLEAVLAWALAEDLPRGSLAERIEAAGGIAPLLSGEAAAN